MGKRHEHSLCWDCSRASKNGCPWAAEGKPVDGWRARKTTIRFSGEKTDSYHVWSCPLFDRDSERGGLKKVALGGDTKNEGSNSNQRGASDAVYRMAQFLGSGNLGSGNRPVVDYRDRQARVLSAERDIIELAYVILERAVLDWKLLEYGRKEAAMVDKGEWVQREDLVDFFFSKWFSRLCEPLQYTPEEIRAVLNIPEDARWTIKQS